jgi:hypothetical protein
MTASYNAPLVQSHAIDVGVAVALPPGAGSTTAVATEGIVASYHPIGGNLGKNRRSPLPLVRAGVLEYLTNGVAMAAFSAPSEGSAVSHCVSRKRR